MSQVNLNVHPTREIVRSEGRRGHDITIIPDENKQTQVGTLSSGSITSDFGNINIGSSLLTAGTSTLEYLTVNGSIANLMSSTDPYLVTTLDVGDDNLGIDIEGSILYVVDNDNGLRTYDISNPISPRLLDTVSLSNPVDVQVSGKYAYVLRFYNSDGLEIVDVSNPSDASVIGSKNLTSCVRSPKLNGKYLYYVEQCNTENFHKIDISDPENLSISSGHVAVGSGANNNYSFVVKGSYAYLTNMNGDNVYLRIIDVSNTEDMALVSSTSLTDEARGGIDVSGNYAYIAGIDYLTVVDISNIDAPEIVASVAKTTSTNDQAIKIAGRYAILSTDGDTVEFFDISDPTNPYRVTTVSTPSDGGNRSAGIAVQGRYVYISKRTKIFVIDMGGINTSSITSGSLRSGLATIDADLDIGRNVRIKNSLNIGEGGLLSLGPISVGVASTTDTARVAASFMGRMKLTVPATSTLSALEIVDGDGSDIFNILDNGKVGIGTSSPAQQLHVYRSDDGAPVRFEDSNGYCEIDPTTTTWSCTSDLRLKKDIETITASSTLEKVMKLNPVTFNWKGELGVSTTSPQTGQRTGLIAQEVEEIFPDLVKTGDDAEGLKSVSYGGLIPYLISVAQEINRKIEKIEEQLANTVTSGISQFKDLMSDRIFGKKVVVEDEFCFDNVCISKWEFKKMMEVAGVKGKKYYNGTTDRPETSTSTDDIATSTDTSISTSTDEISTTTEDIATTTEEVEEQATSTPDTVEIATSTDEVSTTTEESVEEVESAGGNPETEEVIEDIDIQEEVEEEETI